LPKDLENAFKTFAKKGNSSFLLSQVMSASEEMLQSFNEQNFSNSEIGALYKLRRSKHVAYLDAFAEFSRKGNLQDLVAKLKLVIDDEIARADQSNEDSS
jgi:DUF1009 family protein